jgi:hypothetical protein
MYVFLAMPNGVKGAELLLRCVEARGLGFLGTLAPANPAVHVAEVSTEEAATKGIGVCLGECDMYLGQLSLC